MSRDLYQLLTTLLNMVQTFALAWLAAAYKTNGGSFSVRRPAEHPHRSPTEKP